MEIEHSAGTNKPPGGESGPTIAKKKAAAVGGLSCFYVPPRERAPTLRQVLDRFVTGNAELIDWNLQLRSPFLSQHLAEVSFSPLELSKLFLHSMKKMFAGSCRPVNLFRHVHTPLFPRRPTLSNRGNRGKVRLRKNTEPVLGDAGPKPRARKL